MARQAGMEWGIRVAGLLALAATLSCVTTPDLWEPISPTEFHFAPIVGAEVGGPGGWKAARLVITLVRKEGRTAKIVTCQVQVEVPEINWQGVITDEAAQIAAARASDVAAERVLGQNLLSAELCTQFNAEMETALKETVPGARVKRF